LRIKTPKTSTKIPRYDIEVSSQWNRSVVGYSENLGHT